MDSKSFDNSVLCTNESVLIVERGGRRRAAAAPEASRRLPARRRTSGTGSPPCCSPAVGSTSASWARTRAGSPAEAGLRVPNRTRVLLAPFDLVVPEEPLAHEKLCPVLGLVRVPTARRGIDAARAVLRLVGRGHSAAIHSTDPQVDHGVRCRRARCCGSPSTSGNSLGSAGTGDQPGADDDDRDRVLRPVLGGGEPAPQPPGAVDAAGVQPRPGRAVRRLRRAGAVAGRSAVQGRSRRTRWRPTSGRDRPAAAGGGGQAYSPARSELNGIGRLGAP